MKYNNRDISCNLLLVISLMFLSQLVSAQTLASKIDWIRPVGKKSPAVWGIKNGVVFGLWPYALESSGEVMGGGPRGLIRIGYEFKGTINHINYIAVEPVVKNQIEFSEISPSKVDEKWGKFMWTSDNNNPGEFLPSAISSGIITHPDPNNPDIEQLSLYVFMEKFLNGAHPYLKISLRSDRPEEICLEIFNQENSAAMERCTLTATMGNYSRLRLLHLKNQVIDSRQLYKGFEGIDFVEKEGYPAEQMLKDKNGDLIVIAEPNESFAALSAWPQTADYFERRNWRYRPFFKVNQYWRKEKSQYDPSLHVRVNGRTKYWSGGTNDKTRYVNIPGGPAFENFELREKYYPGQKFYFGITRKATAQLVEPNK